MKKHWALIGFILAFLIEENTGFLDLLSENQTIQNLIKGLGAIILAYFWNTPVNENKGIGGRPDDRKPPKK